MRKIYFSFYIYFILIIVSSTLYTFLHIHISNTKIDDQIVLLPFQEISKSPKKYVFECTLHSKISKKRNIGIVVDDKINKIILNGENIDLSYYKKKYTKPNLNDWKAGYQFSLYFHRGDNNLTIFAEDYGGLRAVNIRQSLSIDEYLILLLLVIFPSIYVTSKLFFILLKRGGIEIIFKKIIFYLPIFIILIGLLLRINFLLQVDEHYFQHDLIAHKPMIVYYAEHWLDLAQADKLVQAPQQVLYYLISATIYSISLAQNYTQEQAFDFIRWFSLLYAFGILVVGYYLIRLFSKRVLYVSMFLSFLAFTPYFVQMSGQINNDILNAFLGILSLYYIVSYYKHPTQKKFILIIVIIILAAITKISSLLYALMFLFILLLHYFIYTRKESDFFQQNVIEKRVFLLSIIIIFVFLSILFKAYIPAIGEFRFVNSGLFQGQIIPMLDIKYFFDFNFFDLVSEGQSYVYGKDSIRHSFLTYQYGTMFFGEYDYSMYYRPENIFKLLSQLIYFLGGIYLLGVFSYLFYYARSSGPSKILLFPVLVNIALIIHFLSSYWDICNSDFRYYSPVFGAIGLIFILGWKFILDKHRRYERIFASTVMIFYFLQIYWNIYLVKLVSN